MNRTKIEWVKNPDGTQGYTVNPITGCLNHINGMCKGGNFPCYAYKLANGRLKSLYLNNHNLAPHFTGLPLDYPQFNDPFYPRFWEKRLGEPIEHPTPMQPAKRKGIFVCDMSDLFGIGIPENWTEQVMTTIKLCPYHRFYLLTKQPQNLARWSPFPPNAWVGVTVTSNAAMTQAYYGLSNIHATVRYISFEPLLGSVGVNDHPKMKDWVDWVIIGAQTKPFKPPRFEWVEEIVNAADRAGIPVFIKPPLSDVMNYHRQEFPTCERSRVSSLLP